MAKANKLATTNLKSALLTICAAPAEVAFGNPFMLAMLLSAVCTCLKGVLVCPLLPEAGEIKSAGELSLVTRSADVVCATGTGEEVVIKFVALGVVLMNGGLFPSHCLAIDAVAVDRGKFGDD